MSVMTDLVRMEPSASTIRDPSLVSVLQTSQALCVKQVRGSHDYLLKLNYIRMMDIYFVFNLNLKSIVDLHVLRTFPPKKDFENFK